MGLILPVHIPYSLEQKRALTEAVLCDSLNFSGISSIISWQVRGWYMSKFIDRLNRISQAGPQPMGFRPEQPVSPSPKIQLVASLAQASVSNLADYVAGADAGLLRISKLSSGTKSLKKISQAVPDIPWGGWLRDISWGEMKQTKGVGCDFVVFPAANTSLAILQDSEVGKILEVEASLSEGLLRTIDELPVDAVLIAGEHKEDYFLTWQHLMLFWRFADSLAKPLLVSVPPRVTANELQVLWEAGVAGVIVEAGVEGLKELRQVIDKLTFPPQRRWRKAEALLPHISAGTGVDTEEE